MNTALIFAGGTGQRMNSKTRPKQFLELHCKPIIIYTLEYFQEHKEIDAIAVVCISDWIPYLNDLLEHYQITKVKWVVPGGQTGQQSIYNGLAAMEKDVPEDTVVLIHDGVRPLINSQIISQNIDMVRRRGNAITTSPAIETITFNNTDCAIGNILERNCCRIAKAPQSFLLKDILSAHRKAAADKYDSAIDSATLMKHYGHQLYWVDGPYENIKITTPTDFYIFRAIQDARENSQIFGI